MVPKEIIGIVFILVFASLVLSPCLRNSFTNWDDPRYLTENSDLKDFSLLGAARIISSFYNANYHPLTMLTYFLEYHFFKLNPRGYHITNLFLHLVNCCLVFWFIFLLSKSASVSFVATMLFAIHPLNVEPVAWVSGRKDLLYTLFFVSSLIAYLYYLREYKRKLYYLAICTFILSLFSKAAAITLPFMLLLIDYYNRRKLYNKAVFEKIPFFEISFIFLLICIFTQGTFGAIIRMHSTPLFYRGIIVTYAPTFYLVKLLLPIKLSCRYPYPAWEGVLTLRYLLSPAVIFILAALVIFSKTHTRKIVFGATFFLIAALPVLQIIPFGNSLTADRFNYLPGVGLFYLAGEGVRWLYSRINKYGLVAKITVSLILAGLVLGLSILSWHRSKVWQDSITLWSDVLVKYPDSLTALNNRAIAYSAAGNYAKAIEDLNRAIKLTPQDPMFYFNRANAYRQKGDRDKADLDFKQYLQKSRFWNRPEAGRFFNMNSLDKI